MTNNQSEIERLFFLSMIKKKAGLERLISRGGTLIAEVAEAAGFVGKSSFDDVMRMGGTAAGLSDEAASGLKLIHNLTKSEVDEMLIGLGNVARDERHVDDLMRFARDNGYGSANAAGFIDNFADDFIKLGDDLSTLPTNPPADDLKALYDKHSKVIKAIRSLKAGELDNAMASVRAAGTAASELTDEASAGVNLISNLSKSQMDDILSDVSKIAKNEENKDLIMRFAGNNKYRSMNPNSFMNDFGGDLSKLDDELKALRSKSPTPSADELKKVYDNNKRVVDALGRIRAGDLAGTASGLASKLLSWTGTGAKLVGVVSTVAGLAISGAGLYGLYYLGEKLNESPLFNQIISAFKDNFLGGGGDAILKDFDNIDKASECIKSIKIKSGTAGAKKLDAISERLKDYAKLRPLAERNSAFPPPEVIRSAGEAVRVLSGDSTKDGSIAEFIDYMSKNEGEFAGFSPSVVSLIKGSGDYQIGQSIKKSAGAVGWILTATVALAGFVGYQWLTGFYTEELKCLESAIESINSIDQSIKDAIDAAKKQNPSLFDSATVPDAESKPGGSSQIGAGTSATFAPTSLISLPEEVKARISSPIHGLVGRMIVAMQDIHVGTPGFDLVNEKRKARQLIERAGGISELAADVVIRLNANIGFYANQALQMGDSGIVDENFLKRNKKFAQAIALALPNAVDKFEQFFMKQSSQKRENIMSKISESINNEQLLRKAAKEKASYFDDAGLGLKDQLTKSYYAGLTGMYNEDPPKRSSDYKELYDLHEETGSDLVLQSHPKSVTVADSMGKGGLVENGLEQKEKSTQVALRNPSGNFQSKYAQTITYLEKLSKAADKQGKKEVSSLINQTIKNLK